MAGPLLRGLIQLKTTDHLDIVMLIVAELLDIMMLIVAILPVRVNVS